MIKEIIRTKKSSGQSGEDGNKHLRNRKIEFLCSPEEYKKIQDKFLQSGSKTIAQYCRDSSLTNTKISPANQKTFQTEVLYALSKIGNNINQIAKKINIEKKDWESLPEELKLQIDELKRLQKKYSRGQL